MYIRRVILLVYSMQLFSSFGVVKFAFKGIMIGALEQNTTTAVLFFVVVVFFFFYFFFFFFC